MMVLQSRTFKSAEQLDEFVNVNRMKGKISSIKSLIAVTILKALHLIKTKPPKKDGDKSDEKDK